MVLLAGGTLAHKDSTPLIDAVCRAELQHTKADLQDTKDELQHTKAELQHTKAEIQDIDAELLDTKAELQDTSTVLRLTRADLETTKALVEGLAAEVFKDTAGFPRDPADRQFTLSGTYTSIGALSIETWSAVVNCGLTVAGRTVYQDRAVGVPPLSSQAPTPSPSLSNKPTPNPATLDPTLMPSRSIAAMCGSNMVLTSSGYEFCHIKSGTFTHSQAAEACSNTGLQLFSVPTKAKQAATEALLPTSLYNGWMYLSCPFESNGCYSSLTGWQWANSGTRMTSRYIGMQV